MKVAPFGTRGVRAGGLRSRRHLVRALHHQLAHLRDQASEPANAEGGGVDTESDDIEFKTVDGNDISIDVTVAWRIDAPKAPLVLQRVADSTLDVQERLVRPAARAYVRDALNRLKSEDFYVAGQALRGRRGDPHPALERAEPRGRHRRTGRLGEHLHPAYEEVIREKKLAEQNGEKLASEATAAGEEAKRNLESARGKVNQQIATANGEFLETKLAADAALVRAKNEAEAILLEARTKAQGIEKENAAMAGTGGRTMVKLRIADAMKGKRLVMLPSAGADLQTLDVDALLSSLVAHKVTSASP